MASVTEDLGINRRSRRYRPVDIRWGQSGGTDDSKQDQSLVVVSCIASREIDQGDGSKKNKKKKK